MKITFSTSLFAKRMIVLFCIIVYALDVFARAGGGGGSGGGGGDGLGELIIYLLFAIPFPYNILIIGIIILLSFIGRKKRIQKSVLNKLPPRQVSFESAEFRSMIFRQAGFNLERFNEKVKIAFFAIQNAWAKQNIAEARRFISDGVYQRFSAQFEMMKILEQENQLDDISIQNIQISSIRRDGNFDVLDVAIHASLKDKFRSKRFSIINSGGYESFVEYWSFIKSAGSSEKDIYQSQNCPQCGGALENLLSDVCQCPYCKTYVNSGEFDWVLSEITQADDFIGSNSSRYKMNKLENFVAEIRLKDPQFSIQLAEDKASNAFIQIEKGLVLHKPELFRKFSTDDFFTTAESWMANYKFVYNRFYLNDVALVGAWKKDGKDHLAFYISMSYQRLQIISESAGKEYAQFLEPSVITQHRAIILSRNTDFVAPKARLLSHQCPACGGTLSDTTDVKCPYCGNILNAANFEWTVNNIIPLNQLNLLLSGQENVANININAIDTLFDVRDYALNNILVMFASDGTINNEEYEFLWNHARKLGYNKQKIQPMIDLAVAGRLKIRMPESPKKHDKIIRLMEKAANADNQVSVEELQLLDFMKREYLGSAG